MNHKDLLIQFLWPAVMGTRVGILQFGHDEAKSQSLRFGCDNVFHLIVVTSLIRPWRDQVEDSSIQPKRHCRFNRSNLSNSAMMNLNQRGFDTVAVTLFDSSTMRPSRRVFDSAAMMSSIHPRRPHQFDHDEAKLESLEFSRGDIFYSVAATFLIRPWQGHVGEPSILSQSYLPFGRDNLFDSSMTRPSRRVFDSATMMSSIHHRRPHRFGNDKDKSESLLFGAMISTILPWQARVRKFWFIHGDFSNLSMMMSGRKLFNSTTMTSLIWPWQGLTQPRWFLQFGHDNPKLESLQFGHDDLSNSAITTPS